MLFEIQSAKKLFFRRFKNGRGNYASEHTSTLVLDKGELKQISHKKVQKTQKMFFVRDIFELFAPFCGYHFLSHSQVILRPGFSRPIILLLLILLSFQLNGLSQAKLADEIIYKSLPKNVTLSERDIEDTIKLFRVDNPQKAVENFKEKMSPVVTDAKFRQQVLEKLPEKVKKFKIGDQKIVELIGKILAPVLSFYNRQQAYEIWVINYHIPFIFSDSGVVLVISTELLRRAASDDELLGYAAHEVAHEYYSQTSVYTKHVLSLVIADTNDQALARKYWESLGLIELKCDGFAALTLTELGYDPLASIEGLEKLEQEYSKASVSFHPDSAVRRKVVTGIIPPAARLHKATISNELRILKELITKAVANESNAN